MITVLANYWVMFTLLRDQQGRIQDFSKGVAEVMEAKALKRKNCLWLEQSRYVHNLWINNWLYSPRKLGVLPNKLSSCFFDILSWRPQPLTNLITCLSRVLFDLWCFSTVGKHFSHVLVSFIFAKWNASNFSAQNLSSFAFFQFLWADFTNIPRALADNIRWKRTQHTICKVTLHEFHCRPAT